MKAKGIKKGVVFVGMFCFFAMALRVNVYASSQASSSISKVSTHCLAIKVAHEIIVTRLETSRFRIRAIDGFLKTFIMDEEPSGTKR